MKKIWLAYATGAMYVVACWVASIIRGMVLIEMPVTTIFIFVFAIISQIILYKIHKMKETK